jgi:hypothetical protein
MTLKLCNEIIGEEWRPFKRADHGIKDKFIWYVIKRELEILVTLALHTQKLLKNKREFNPGPYLLFTKSVQRMSYSLLNKNREVDLH